MIDSAESDKINEAIVRFVWPAWTKEREQAISDAYGPEIAAKTRAVYNEALDRSVDWRKETMDTALSILADFLAKRFPWLSSEAKTRLNYCFLMTWK
jgi:hypothetical protein